MMDMQGTQANVTDFWQDPGQGVKGDRRIQAAAKGHAPALWHAGFKTRMNSG
jgi:hypothetical protein